MSVGKGSAFYNSSAIKAFARVIFQTSWTSPRIALKPAPTTFGSSG